MKRLLLLAAVLAGTAALCSPALASTANGGGRGTVDGVNPFSQFGFGVTYSGGSVNGHFTCLMAGGSRFPGFEPLMQVEGQVYAGSVDPALGVAEFTGSGTLNLGPSGRMNALFHVDVTEGGAGQGTLTLTVIEPAFPLPTEHVLSGRITVH